MKSILLISVCIVCLFVLKANAQAPAGHEQFKITNNALFHQPVLFADLGESFATPDAMALDKEGRLYLSVPNFANYAKYGSKICRFNGNDQAETWLDSLPKHPETKRVHPMGMDFGPDGHLYIADAQSAPAGKNVSRLLRVVIKDGRPVRTEVLVEGFNSANGVKWFKDRIYISDSYLYVEGQKDRSCVFSFSLAELNKGKIHLTASANDDPHLLCRFTSKVFNDKHDQGGVDGIAFDKQGNLYAGNFSDGVISRIEFNSDRMVQSQKIIVDSDSLRCCDGMFYDKKTNSIYIANFANNSIHRLDLSKKQLDLLWENGDTTGVDGSLDQPCEPVLYKGRFIVVNFDSFPGFKNKEADAFHTMSAFEIH